MGISVTNNIPVNVNEQKATKFQVTEDTQKGRFIDDIINYTFINENGQKEKYQFYGNKEKISPYCMAFNQYSTDDNPEITPKELLQIKEDILRKTVPVEDFGNFSGAAKVTDYFRLLDLYADENSEGGKSITPKEQAKVTSIFIKRWFKRFKNK